MQKETISQDMFLCEWLRALFKMTLFEDRHYRSTVYEQALKHHTLYYYEKQISVLFNTFDVPKRRRYDTLKDLFLTQIGSLQRATKLHKCLALETFSQETILFMQHINATFFKTPANENVLETCIWFFENTLTLMLRVVTIDRYH